MRTCTPILVTVLAVAGLLPLAGCGGGRTATAAPAPPLTDTPQFRIEIDGVAAADPVVHVDVAPMLIGTTESRTVDQRDLTSAPDGRRPSTLTLHLAYDEARLPAIFEWVRGVYGGTDIRKDIAIIVLKRDGSEARRFNLFECFPTYWTIGSSSAGRLRWTLEVRVNRIEMA